MLIFSLLNLLLNTVKIVNTLIPFGVDNQSFFFKCQTDECICAYESNHDQFCSKILTTTRLLNYLINDENREENLKEFNDTRLRQIERQGSVQFRLCSNNQYFQTYSIKDYNLHIKLKSSTVALNEIGVEKCLIEFCTQIPQQKEYLGVNFKCHDNNITNLFSYYVNETCFSKIRYVHIKSTSLTKIGYDSFLFNSKIKWRILYVTIEFASNVFMNTQCDVFRYLYELRTLRLNVFNVPRYKCIFRYNPDLVKISWKNIRIWNMCNGSIEIWTPTRQYNETSFNLMFFNQIHNFSNHKISKIDQSYIAANTIVVMLIIVFIIATMYTKKLYELFK